MQLNDCLLIGDKGYISAEIQMNLFEDFKTRIISKITALTFIQNLNAPRVL